MYTWLAKKPHLTEITPTPYGDQLCKLQISDVLVIGGGSCLQILYTYTLCPC